jgi:hypothetical protein
MHQEQNSPQQAKVKRILSEVENMKQFLKADRSRPFVGLDLNLNLS